MNILITGATGYIGREFVRHATAAGHVCTSVGRVLNVPPALAAIDWRSYGALVHLAAAGVRRVAPDRTWADCIATNFEGTRNLLHSLSASGATPTVFISGSIREAQTKERPDYWSDPYIVSQKLRRMFVEEWAKGYGGRVVHPFCERCGDVADVDRLCADILREIRPANRWIKTSERYWTEEEREAGVWIWEGNFPLLMHRPDEQPRMLPRWSENPPFGSWSSGMYASEWMLADGATPPERPRPPSPIMNFHPQTIFPDK